MCMAFLGRWAVLIFFLHLGQAFLYNLHFFGLKSYSRWNCNFTVFHGNTWNNH